MTASADNLETRGLAPPDVAEPASRPAARSLRWGVSWTFLGNVVFLGSLWVMLVILAKLTTPETVGKFVLAVAICAPVFYFSNMALRYVLVTDAKREFAFGDYLGLRLLSAAAGFLVVLGIALVGPYPRETAVAIAVVGLAKVFEVVGDVFHGLFQREERMDLAAKSMILKGLVSLGGLALGVYLSGGLFYGALALVAAWALGLACYDIPMGRLLQRARTDSAAALAGIRPRWDSAALRRLALVALPLGISGALVSLNNSVPRYFIDRYCGERALGVFGAIASLMMAGGAVVAAVCTAASPRLARYYASGQAAAFRRLLLRLVAISLALGVGGVAVALLGGRPLLRLLYRPEYGDQVELFVGVMIVGVPTFLTWSIGTGLVAARYFRVQPILIAVSFIVTVGLCVLLIPGRGALGAVIAAGVASLVHAAALLACTVWAIRALAAPRIHPGDPA